MTHSFSDSIPDLVGAVINNRWRITHTLGRGGTSIVFCCSDVCCSDNRQRAALKMLMRTPPMQCERFLREVETVKRLSERTQRVVKIYDSGVHDGRPFYVMELADACLSDVFYNANDDIIRYEESDALWLIREAAIALHESSIVHRDVKPDNFFIFGEVCKWVPLRRTARVTIKIGDFGMAYDEELAGKAERLTATGVVMGTPEFMSPEQFRCSKSVDQRTDVYALGVMLYGLAVGFLPFLGDIFEIASKHAHETPVFPMRLSSGTQRIIARALAKCPADRYEHPMAMAQDISRVLRQGGWE